MMRLVLCILATVTTACGVAGPDAEHASTSPHSANTEARLFPSAPTQSSEQDAERVWATPELLTFFGDYQASSELLSRDVAIVNDTPHPIHILNVSIADDGSVVSRHGSDFFDVEWDTESTLMVPPESRVQVKTRFLRSLEQRSASMIVETTHPDFPELVIVLTGKYFMGDAGW